MAKITVDTPDADVALLDNEATDKDLARWPYMLSLVMQRHEKTINVQANDKKLIGRMEGKLEAQPAQITDLTEGRSKACQQAGLAGVETANVKVGVANTFRTVRHCAGRPVPYYF